MQDDLIQPFTDINPPTWLAALLLFVAVWVGVQIVTNITHTLTEISQSLLNLGPHKPPPSVPTR